MAEPPASRLLSSFTTLKDVYALLSAVTEKACELRSPGKVNNDVASSYIQQLSNFKDEATSLYIRSCVVSSLNPSKIADAMKKAEESNILSQIDTAMGSVMEALKGQDNLLSIASLQGQATGNTGTSRASVLSAEAQKLTQLKQTMKTLFVDFFSLYEEQLIAHLRTELESSSANGDDIADIANLLCLSFHKSPFHPFNDESSFDKVAPILASLNSRENSDVGYLTVIRNTAGRWVDDYTRNIPSNSGMLTSLGDRYLQLLVGFKCFLDVEVAALSQTLLELNAPLNSPALTASFASWTPDSLRSNASRLFPGESDRPGTSPTDLEATEARETKQQSDLLRSIYALVNKEIDREHTRKFSVALCGMVKSGKSLFLGAVLGHSILPSDELPSTAWPCRIRHVKGQSVPHLILCEPGKKPIFQGGIVALRSKLKELTAKKSHSDGRLSEEEYMWEHNIAPATKKNWDIFKRPSFVLPNEADGEEDVYKLLAQMNDVVRLCRSFGVKLNPEHGSWPLVTVQFELLRDEPLGGIFEFYDLPGVGEFTEYFLGFQELISLVAQEVNAIVPIVSLKEASKSDWRSELPQIILSATGMREPSIIICTHRDQVEERHLETQTSRVLTAFSPSPNNAKKTGGAGSVCVSCASRLGLGAQMLSKMSRQGKPDYDEIIEESMPEAVRDCVKHIVGSSRRAKKIFEQLSDEDWIDALQDQLNDSGLTEAMRWFSECLAKDAHSTALHRGISSISRLLNKFCSIQSEALLRMRRTKQECEAARSGFLAAERAIKSAQQSWVIAEGRLRSDALDAIRREFNVLENECLNAAPQLFGDAERKFVAKYQNVKARHELFEDAAGRLRFTNEALSVEFLGEVHQVARTFLAARRGIAVTDIRRTIVDEEIKQQLDLLTATITVHLGGEHGALLNRLDHEMNDIDVSIHETSLSTFITRASRKVTERERLSFSDKLFEGFKRGSIYHVYFDVPKDEAARNLREELIRPYLQEFRDSAEAAFKRMMELGFGFAETTVNTLLSDEKKGYELELSKKDKEPPQDVVASCMSSYMNCSAAEAALQKLESLLDKHRRD